MRSSSSAALSKKCRTQQGRSQGEDQDQHHHRGPEQLASSGPRHLVHLRLDGDQEIGKGGHVDHPVRHPHAERPAARRESGTEAPASLGPRVPIAERAAEPQQPQRDRHRQRGKGHLPGNPALAPLVDAGMQQFLEKRAHRKVGYLLGPIQWQGRGDSNSQPLVLETSALPIELHPYGSCQPSAFSFQSLV